MAAELAYNTMTGGARRPRLLNMVFYSAVSAAILHCQEESKFYNIRSRRIMQKYSPYQLAPLEGKSAIEKTGTGFPKKASREIFWMTWRDLEDRTSRAWDGGVRFL
ncbi:MAG: hypothetical protein NTZ95_07395 [Candidatus Omnitrophica bacterium]|nr:hypothetical protein [Candidatus Omnitrophota bacterium]